MSKLQRFPKVGQLFVPRDQIVQGQCWQISGAGPGQSDLTAQRVALQKEKRCYFDVFRRKLRQQKQTNFPNGKVHTH